MIRYCFEKAHPSSPNFALGAIHFLNSWLNKTDVLLEYGSGKSTAWFAERVNHIISIEDNPLWYEKVKPQTAMYDNVELFLFEFNSNDYVRGSGVSWEYVNKMNEFAPETFSCIIDDGWARSYVGVRGLSLLKPGGIFVWDDWAGVFPTSTHIPGALPSDFLLEDRVLLDFWAKVKEWRQVWHDDGTHSTAIFFKPL